MSELRVSFLREMFLTLPMWEGDTLWNDFYGELVLQEWTPKERLHIQGNVVNHFAWRENNGVNPNIPADMPVVWVARQSSTIYKCKNLHWDGNVVKWKPDLGQLIKMQREYDAKKEVKAKLAPVLKSLIDEKTYFYSPVTQKKYMKKNSKLYVAQKIQGSERVLWLASGVKESAQVALQLQPVLKQIKPEVAGWNLVYQDGNSIRLYGKDYDYQDFEIDIVFKADTVKQKNGKPLFRLVYLQEG